MKRSNNTTRSLGSNSVLLARDMNPQSTKWLFCVLDCGATVKSLLLFESFPVIPSTEFYPKTSKIPKKFLCMIHHLQPNGQAKSGQSSQFNQTCGPHTATSIMYFPVFHESSKLYLHSLWPNMNHPTTLLHTRYLSQLPDYPRSRSGYRSVHARSAWVCTLISKRNNAHNLTFHQQWAA